MADKINVRSPYLIKIESASPALGYVDFELRIWSGNESPVPTPASYTFTKSVIGTNDYVTFEIADYIRDYISTEYGDIDRSTSAVWVEWSYIRYEADDSPIDTSAQTVQKLAVDGYGFFEDGINPEIRSGLMQDNTDVYYNDGDDIIIPVFSEVVESVEFPVGDVPTILWDQYNAYWENASAVWESGGTAQGISDSTDSDYKIMYVRITDTADLPDIQQLNIVHRTGEGSDEVVYLRKVCEPKYSPFKAVFYNKYGAMQELTFFKRSDTTLTVSSDRFKRNIVDFTSSPTYNTAYHQVKSFNVNGKEQITLNTGFIVEEFNGLIKQLMLAEEVWLDDGTQVLPVLPVTNSLQMKQNVNDKLINYTLSFEYAYDKINNIR